MTIFNRSVSDTLVFGGVLASANTARPWPIENRTRDAIVDQIVYELKRTRPTRLDLYKIAYHLVDLETGVKTIDEDRLQINRAVVLPSQLESKFTFDLAYLAASRDFTEGGFYQQRLRTVLIDAQDIPNGWGQPTTEQRVVLDNRSWKVLKVTNLGWRSFALVIKQTDGIQIVRGENANNNIHFTQTVVVT